jgi:molybdenum cofactor guanylyltransferase
MYDNVTGVLLSGGKSSRMGVNKSFLKFGDELVIEKILNLMKSLFKKNILITNSPREYEFLGIPVFTDIFRGIGPLGGIHSGIMNSGTERIFVMSCDIPLMTKEMISYIIEYKPDADVKICEAAGYTQPLVGLYNKNILDDLNKYLNDWEEIKTDGCRIKNFLTLCSHEIINPEPEEFYRDEIFFNMNKPEDYEYLLKCKFSLTDF